MKITLIVILVLAVLLIGWGVSVNNRLVVFNESINGAWAQVETVLQRRYDLIPNLVNTVKGYAKHESGVLEEVTRLRSQWGEAKTTDSKIAAANQLEGALSRLMVVIEKYPDLKANQNFLALQDELAGTENRIAVERRRYNETVQQYCRPAWLPAARCVLQIRRSRQASATSQLLGRSERLENPGRGFLDAINPVRQLAVFIRGFDGVTGFFVEHGLRERSRVADDAVDRIAIPRAQHVKNVRFTSCHVSHGHGRPDADGISFGIGKIGALRAREQNLQFTPPAHQKFL